MSIHPTALVAPDAEIDPTAEIGPYVTIDGRVRISAGTRVLSHASVVGWTHVGVNCTIHSFATVGGEPQDRAYRGEESYCEIGEGTIVREYASIHRGTAPGSTTIVGRNCFLMGSAHVAHNCKLGDNVVVANLSLLAGHVEVGDNAFISGGVAVHQFVRIGELAMLGGLTKAVMDIPPFFTVDRDGRCAGVNVVGLRRAGMSREERIEVKDAFRTLYRSGKPFQEAVACLSGSAVTPAAHRLVEFLSMPTQRGIASARGGSTRIDVQ